MQNSKVGNVFEDRLADLWVCELEAYRDYTRFEKCARCELLADGRVQALGYARYKEMIRLSGRAVPVPQEEQARWIETIFSEQPYLANVYPGDTRDIGIVFVIRQADDRVFQPRRAADFPRDLLGQRRAGRAEGLPHHRRLHRLRALRVGQM